MKYYFFAVLISVLLIIGCNDNSHPKEKTAALPDSVAHRYSIAFSGKCRVQAMTDSHIRWKDSLVRNLGHKGNIHVFMRTDIQISDKGQTCDSRVYQNTEIPSQYLVFYSNQSRHVVIDLQKKIVGTMGTDGVTIHPHQDGLMVICLEPAPGSGILGVPLGDSKAGVQPPVFQDTSVKWSW